MNVKEKVSGDICCGCGACIDSCPTGALSFEYDDKDWHLHPLLDTQKCISCGKCLKTCPAINEKVVSDFEPFGYAAVSDDEVRMNSSSGGIFYPIAKYFISKRGYVAGAVYDESLTVKHIVSNSLEDVKRMQKSKYVQSDASGVYGEVEKLLKMGNRVMFTGTPCQVAALRLFLKKDYKDLCCVEILCHGVPSPKVFDYYLNENFVKSDISDVIFRNKKHRNGNPGSITVVLRDGREFYSEYFDNSYYDAFAYKLTQRKSCFNCKYAEFPRVADITIGDFWGAKTTETKIDYEKGCSIVIINTDIGEKIAKKALKSLKSKENYSIETLMSWNRNKRILESPRYNPDFIELIKRHNSLRVAYQITARKKYDVGVFGVTMNPNFGGLVTYWALYEAIRSMGYTVAVIGRPINSADSKNITHSNRFFSQFCETTEQIPDSRLKELNSIFDKFVIGSDQIWNYDLFKCWKESLYLDFVDDFKTKIAYASSFGHSEHKLPKERVGQVSKYFKHFDRIGVREADGVKILKENYGVDSKHVFDPVFLVELSKYCELAQKSRLESDGAFVGSYIIEPNDFKLSVVKKIVEHLGIKNVNITDGDPQHFSRKSQWFRDRDMHIMENAEIFDWLKMIIDSEFVITDSYHAACFCIMFKKPFILLQERWALSRIESIMNIFGLHNRWLKINDMQNFVIDPAWFRPIVDTDVILQEKIKESYDWLKDALSEEKPLEFINKFDALLPYQRVEDYFYFLMRDRKNYIMILTSANISKDVLQKIDFKSKLSFMEINTSNSSSLALLFDFDEDYIEIKNIDINEISYSIGEEKIRILVDNSTPKTNNIYTTCRDRRRASILNTDAGVVISIYSKLHKKVIDSFEVVVENDIAVIKR